MTPEKSTVTDIDAFLSHYAYLECRANEHGWPKKVPWLLDGDGAQAIWTRTRACRDCGTVRIDRMTIRRTSLHPLYHYPDEYRAEPGLKFSRDDARWFEIQHSMPPELDPPRRSGNRSRKRATPAPTERTRARRKSVSR